jgi:hypothetical protein
MLVCRAVATEATRHGSHLEPPTQDPDISSAEASQSEDVEVGQATCYRHRGRETKVSCSDCGRPICTDCMIYSPVGIKCPECAKLPRSARVRLKPDRAARAVLAAVLGGAAIGFGILLLQGIGLFFALILGWLVGIAMGELVLWASGRFRSPITSWIAVAGSLWAYLFPYLLAIGIDAGEVANTLARAPFVVIGAGIAGYVAYQRTQ